MLIISKPLGVPASIITNALLNESNNLLQQIKRGNLSYEDENFSYIIITKENYENNYCRILRHPEILKGHINLKVCERGEIKNITISTIRVMHKKMAHIQVICSWIIMQRLLEF